MSVSNVSSSSSSTAAAATGVSPTNTGTISFTGVGGFNYSTIIQKLTAISQQQEVPYQNTITKVNAQNTELTTIQNLLSSLQGSLNGISDPKTFQAFSATPSDLTQLSAAADSASTPIAGTYTINSTTLGTATSIHGASGVGHKVSDTVGGTPSNSVPLIDAYVATTPHNGSTGSGSLTIDGVKIAYDVTSQSLDQIITTINTAVQAVDPGFTASYDSATDKVSFSSSDKPISLGATNDTGNLLTVLKLDTAQITNGAASGSVSSASGIGGVNPYLNLSGTNAAGNTVDGNFATSVTAGVFTINGVSFTVAPTTQALSDVISSINSSTAGVIASYDTSSGTISLTNKGVGAQSIVIGGTGDTSNFLTASGLKTGTTTLGTQSSVSYNDLSGTPHVAYANSNVVSGAIPGFDLTILKTTAPGTTSTITVGQSSATAVTAINGFVTAYNAVINELNSATAAPVVQQANGKSQAIGGGIFYGNSILSDLRNQLINLVSGQQPTTSNYNSLSSIGLQLDSSFSVLTANQSAGTSVSGSSNTSTSSGLGVSTFQGTDGAFQALNTTAFAAAFAADPQAVQNLFTNSANFVNQLGQTLTNETGFSTVLASGLAGVAPAISVLGGLQAENTNLIASSQTRIDQIQAQITQQANALNTEYGAASATIAGLQQQQSYLAEIGGSASTSSSSSGS